jgi:hypothetical protein
MSKTTYEIKTWVCPQCEYHQDIDPNDQIKMRLIYPNVEIGYCPNCFQKDKWTKLNKETDPKKLIKIIIMGQEEIKDMRVSDPSLPKQANGSFSTRILTELEKKEVENNIVDKVQKFLFLKNS